MAKQTTLIEPGAIWSMRLYVFDKALTLTQNILLSQGRFALQTVVEKIDALYEQLHFMPNLIEAYPHS